MSTLSVKNLKITIGHHELIKQLSLTFLPGETWGILGPNGAGKTTLLHTFAGLKKPSQGKIFLNDLELHQHKTREKAKKIGLLQQHISFPFPSTVLETVLIGRYPYAQQWFKESEEDYQIAYAALEKMHLKDFAHRSVYSLSGGEQRRLTLATLLTQNPDIYLLDEPINHLDMQQRLHALSIFNALAKEANKTIIMVLHDIYLIKKFCDHVILMGDDNLHQFGSSTDILNDTALNSIFDFEISY